MHSGLTTRSLQHTEYAMPYHIISYHATTAYSVNGFDFILHSSVTKLLTLVLTRSHTDAHTHINVHMCAYTNIPHTICPCAEHFPAFYLLCRNSETALNSIHAAVIDTCNFGGGSVRVVLLRNIDCTQQSYKFVWKDTIPCRATRCYATSCYRTIENSKQ